MNEKGKKILDQSSNGLGILAVVSALSALFPAVDQEFGLSVAAILVLAWMVLKTVRNYI